jgi:predicted ATPase with chaperone activity
VLKAAISLADLEKTSYPELSHYQEALSYRPTMDKRTGN